MLLLPAFTGTPELNRIHNCDALTLLRAMPSESVNCIVTSPPYYGLRDYQTDGQIGLEDTPEQFVAALVSVFREARRVLRDDGVLFLNLGDTYYSPNGHSGGGSSPKSTLSGGGGKYRAGSKNEAMYNASRERHALAYGSDGIGEQGSLSRGYPSGSPYGGHTDAWWSHIAGTDGRRVHGQALASCLKIQESTAAQLGHLPIADCSLPLQTGQSLAAILDHAQSAILACEQLRAFHQTTTDESYPQPQDGLTRDGMLSAYLASLRSLVACVRGFAHKWDGALGTPYGNQDNASLCAELVDRIQCISGYCSLVAAWLNTPYIQPYCTTLNLKPKDLIGIPWMVAFALRADGWYLRSDIIWHKPAPMPESVTDRPTKSHEYVFLLTKSARYWYDADAIKEDSMDPTDDRKSRSKPGDKRLPTNMVAGVRPGSATYSKRNKRSVWTISTKPFKDAHFATFPPDLIEPMILAGCPDKVCAECGAPYEKVMSDERLLDTNRPQARRALELFEAKGLTESHLEAIRAVGLADAGKTLTTMDGAGKNTDEMQRLADEAKAALGGYYREFTFGQRSVAGLQPTCSCNADTVAGVVYDPFMGSGTTARVAVKLGRQYIGSEINYEYACMGRDSLRKPFEKTLRKKVEADLSDLPMFSDKSA